MPEFSLERTKPSFAYPILNLSRATDLLVCFCSAARHVRSFVFAVWSRLVPRVWSLLLSVLVSR